MAVVSNLLSVAEFASLPQRSGGIRQELRHGELVESPPVKTLHSKIQKRLMNLLEEARNAAEHGVVMEFPFRPEPEYELWVADVAVLSLARWEETADHDYYRGVPLIVIEVLSPSNSASEMLDREEICLRNGGQEFWLVDPRRESVKVIRAGGYSVAYDVEGVLESGALGGSIAVRDIFAR